MQYLLFYLCLIMQKNSKLDKKTKTVKAMKKQNYTNHHRWVPGYHFVLSSLLIVGTLIAAVNALRHLPNHGGFVSAMLIEDSFACGLLLFCCTVMNKLSCYVTMLRPSPP